MSCRALYPLLLAVCLGCSPSDPPRNRATTTAPVIPASPLGPSTFEEVNKRLLAMDRGTRQSAFGNTQAAVDAAVRFNEVITAMENLFFTGGDEDRFFSLTDETFMTHCELREGKALFLVHVPQLKNYRGEVREVLLQLAWATAQLVTEDLCPDCRLGVGLRGAVAYGAAAMGQRSTDAPSMQLGLALSTGSLESFFTGPELSVVASGSPDDTTRDPPNPETGSLVAGLSSDSSEVRLEAIRRLGELEGNISPAFGALTRIVHEDRYDTLRAEAIRLLANKQGARAVPTLETALHQVSWYKTCRAAALGLVEVGEPGWNALKRQFESAAHTRVCILSAVETMGSEATAFRPLLRRAAHEPNHAVNAAALRTLGALGDLDSLPVMTAALTNRYAQTRVAGAIGLEGLGPEAAPATEELAAAYFRANNRNERETIVRALASIGPSAKVTLELLHDEGHLSDDEHERLIKAVLLEEVAMKEQSQDSAK